MTAAPVEPLLRPGPTGIAGLIQKTVVALIPFGMAVLRRFKPILRVGKLCVVTRYDDVLEIFATDPVFGVPYKSKLDVIMDGQPFILGMSDTAQYRAHIAAMRRVVLPVDLPALARDVEARAEAIVSSAAGRLDVVDALVRKVTFAFLPTYLGLPEFPNANLQVWCTRLFEYQFVSSDAPLVAEVSQIAPVLRAHIQSEIDRRRKQSIRQDDVIGRCLELQAAGESVYSDDLIRTEIMGLLVGGPPQPPMVVPQALEQLLRRPDALRGAQAAATADDDILLAGYVREAMRFDPLAPGLQRAVLRDWPIARGTSREITVTAGTQVFAAFASAMMDKRRIPDPYRFDPRRQPHEYIHFGYGLHQCFGMHINNATLHLMLKPLLKRPNLRRAEGPLGRLQKTGPFASSLVVEYD